MLALHVNLPDEAERRRRGLLMQNWTCTASGGSKLPVGCVHCQQLTCADLSICPSNCGCNTASVALIIGEKAAEIVSDELARA